MKQFLFNQFFVIAFVSYGYAGSAQFFYASQQSSWISTQNGTCEIDQPDYCVDTIPSNFTLYQINSTSPGDYINQSLYYNTTVPAGSIVYITIEDPNGNQLNNQLISSLTISSLKDSTTNNDDKNGYFLNLTGIENTSRYLIAFTPYLNFDGINIRMSSGVPNAISSLRIYNSYFIPNLPTTIDLLEFKATKNKKEITLNWTVGHENNFLNYTVEKSNNGLIYEPIGIVQSNTNSSVTVSYNFTDGQPFNGTNYYRIYVTDLNGNRHYYSPIAVEFNAVEIHIFPNPSDGCNINILIENEDTEIYLYDQWGQLMYKSLNGTETGTIIIRPSELNLSRGFYTLAVLSNDDLFTEKIIIR